MRIHKEGTTIITISAAILAVLVFIAAWLLPDSIAIVISVLALLTILFIISFFRTPARKIQIDKDTVFSPADGRVVVVEEVQENEYLGDRRIQVSVFMSIWNVHVNWFPVAGKVVYFKHHHGKFMVAWHPKSSEDNERTTTVVDMGQEKILFRQIAGLVARRIVSYAKVGEYAVQNSQCGFIKFGSRVDIFLPLDADVKVQLGDKVFGTRTVIATLKHKE